MSRKRETAGKTAKNTRRTWRTVTRDGVTRLVAPDGTRYAGTAAEVREAALTPDRRNALAQSLQLARYCRDKGTFDAAGCRAYAMQRRREAIQCGAFDAKAAHVIEVDAKTVIMLKAGARLMGRTFDGFLAEVFSSQQEALLEYAQSETGRREIPLTRHERAALARLDRA